MKRDILVLALSITLLAMCSCAESPLPQPPDNIFVDAGIITRLTETGLPITSAITTTAGTTVTTPPPEVSDEIEAEYSFTFNGKVYKVDLEGTFYQGDIHFFLDEDTLYLVNSVCVPDYDNGMNSNSEYFNLHELFSGKLPADDNMIKMNLLESCTGENVVGIADMYKRLNEISPRWTNAGENRTDFIACGSFIRGDCYDLTDEEYTLIHTSYYERTSAVIAYSEAQSKADKICSDYTLFITPENINELSKFDGAAVKNLRCYLSEDGLDLAPLTKIKTYMWAGPSYNDTSYIFVSRTPANSEFIDMVNGVENFSGRLSYWKGNATGFYNCDIITDCELPLNFYMGNCDITLEKPLSGMVNTATFKSCRFDRIPDFSKLTVSIDASNPYITDNWADFTFNNPGQKATGFEKMTFEADTDIYLNGDIDIPNFDFLKNKIYDHIVEINSTGNINIEDLIMNDYDFKGISFIDCATKEQFDRLVKKYPDNYVSVEINEVLFEHGNKPLNF